MSDHVHPFVHETLTDKALHFSIHEVQSRMKLKDPFALALEYTRTMMGFLMFVPDPRQILMIGLGGGSLAKFCHRHLPNARTLVLEINPHVIALRPQFHVPPDDARLQVLNADGAVFLRHADIRPDVLLVDGFDSDGQPDDLCSQAFYDDCADLLAPQGVLAVNLHHGHRHYARYLGRIQRSFDGAVLAVEDSDGANSIAFGCKGTALARVPSGIVPRPKGLARSGNEALLGAFARVSRALAASRAP